MANVIACRIMVVGDAPDPYAVMADLGLNGVEVPPPADGDYAGMAARAEAAGIRITSLASGIALADEANLKAFEPVIRGAGKIGTPIIFVSVQGSDTVPRSTLMERWRRLGDLAGENGVVLSTETHEPFGHNGDIACRTMRELDHPNLRMNFDTANVYYYNHDIDGVTELKKELDYVASVHLKDTPGGYHDMNFPVFGQGIVDFSGVFKVLNAHGFSGPFTMELEGPLTADKTLEERVASVKACMDYLRSIGAC